MTRNVYFFLQGKQLDKKEAELKALDAFYREQIAQLQKKVGDFPVKQEIGHICRF